MFQIFLISSNHKSKACREFSVKPLNKLNLLAMEDLLDKLFSAKNTQEIFSIINNQPYHKTLLEVFLGDSLSFKVYLEHHYCKILCLEHHNKMKQNKIYFLTINRFNKTKLKLNLKIKQKLKKPIKHTIIWDLKLLVIYRDQISIIK